MLYRRWTGTYAADIMSQAPPSGIWVLVTGSTSNVALQSAIRYSTSCHWEFVLSRKERSGSQWTFVQPQNTLCIAAGSYPGVL